MKNIITMCALVVLGAGGYWALQTMREDIPYLASPDPKNMSYIVEGVPVALVNGLSEQEIVPGTASKTVTRYFGNEAKGDLNNDGKEDTAFLLTREMGGSGIFYYVAAVVSNENEYAGTNAILLGDRIAPQTTEFHDGKIVVNYAEHASEDPLSAIPSLGVSRTFEVVGGILRETE